MTVSKIFIIGPKEVKPTLEKFMDPTSIPKKYGGQLDWAWGDSPDLDEETRTALEKDGNKGWVKGPALWLNNERIVVGSENDKLRRSDKEIAEKKPIVYAADYTEDPVHPEKRASIVSGSKKSLDVQSPRQNATVLDHPSPLPESPSTLVEDKQLGASAAAAAASTQTTGSQQPAPALSPIPSHIPIESVRTGPMGDSQVHLPENQAAAPSTTAEYISPVPSKGQTAAPEAKTDFAPGQTTTESSQKAPTSDPALQSAQAVPAVAVTSSNPPDPVQRETASPPPPGHTQPGPLSAHTAEIHRTIARKLEGESTIEIPASANGALAHPDIIATSDAGKGLAMEAEKLALTGGAGAARPQPERFVTAMEVIH